MKICTWNANSIKARAEVCGLLLDAHQPDLIAIQELKLEASEVPRALFEERGYHLAIHAQKTWNGVLIASKQPITDVIAGVPTIEAEQARVLAVTTLGTRFVNLYCPQGQRTDSPKYAYKLRFYDALVDWLGETIAPSAPDGRWVVLGDLNIAPEPRDIWDPARFRATPSFTPEEHARWAKVIALGLEDVVKERVPPKTYSFWDYRGGAFHKKQGMRIDHILASPPVAGDVAEAFVARDWRKKQAGLTPSDHAPVFVTLGSPA